MDERQYKIRFSYKSNYEHSRYQHYEVSWKDYIDWRHNSGSFHNTNKLDDTARAFAINTKREKYTAILEQRWNKLAHEIHQLADQKFRELNLQINEEMAAELAAESGLVKKENYNILTDG